MTFAAEVLLDSPVGYWQHRSAGSVNETDVSGNGNTLVYGVSGVTVQQASLIGEPGDYAVGLDGAAGYGSLVSPAAITGASAISLEWVGRITSPTATSCVLMHLQPDQLGLGSNYSGAAIHLDTSGNLVGYCCQTGGAPVAINTALDIRDSAPRHVALTADGANVRLYVNGAEVGSAAMTGLDIAATPGNDLINVGAYMLLWALSIRSGFLPGEVCESAVYDAALSASRLAAHAVAANLGSAGTPAAALPLTLSGRLHAPVSALPLRLKGLAAAPAAALPVRLESPDPAHYLATAARWGLSVSLDGVAIGGRLVGAVEIAREEDASTLCNLRFRPLAGVIDPAAYERKYLTVTFVAYDSAGAVLYQVRRFTGTSTAAEYDPDRGTLTLEATTDLQGRLEQLERAVLEQLIGGQWSPHVFDETADGYQYARDRLSTVASEMHVDDYGRLVVVPWAAKGTPDVTLSDAGRFADTLAVRRATRRDLLTRVALNIDFRFVRLRHRELTVQFIDQLGFCHYLNNGWKLASKNMITQAADGSAWTRTSPITFVELPGPGTYCTPVRGWAGNAQAFALGASWTAARRWAQTVTEQYRLEVVASDLEAAIGRQSINADYGLEAVFDAGDYERIREFDGPPAGSVLAPESDDYQLNADQAEYSGRTALEAAITCAIAWARGQLLGRARTHRVRLGALWRPDITLASTVRVQTPDLDATGKVAAITETLDPISGALDMRLAIALSRHDGSGLAVDDPVAAPAAPAQTGESATARTYTVGYHLGGLLASPVDDEDFDGQITNVAAAVQEVGGELYRERFALRMPEIEAPARDASVLAQTATHSCAIPQDPLTMSV